MRMCPRVGSLVKLKQQTTAALQVLKSLLAVAREHIAEFRLGRGHALATGRFHVANEAAIVSDDARVTEESDALGRRHTPEQAFAFNKTDNRFGIAGRASENVHRTADELAIIWMP